MIGGDQALQSLLMLLSWPIMAPDLELSSMAPCMVF
jgi:hypothetical protein